MNNNFGNKKGMVYLGVWLEYGIVRKIVLRNVRRILNVVLRSLYFFFILIGSYWSILGSSYKIFFIFEIILKVEGRRDWR